ncbi:MAG TPA: hypothetical protein PKK26_04475 [Candidatus Wallbacteria bacterium]|nr:hypothetical protein [Candidatus Wallbacteria bacterium]
MLKKYENKIGLTAIVFTLIIFAAVFVSWEAAYSQDAPPAAPDAAPAAPDAAPPADAAATTPAAAPDAAATAPATPDAAAATPAATTAAAPAAGEEEPLVEYSPKDKSKDPKDPFKPLVMPPPPVAPPVSQQQNVAKKTEVQVPPLPLKVTFICGSDAKKIAVLSLNNKTYEMAAGEQEDSGLFKILEVTDSKVKIFDSRVQKERDIFLQGL